MKLAIKIDNEFYESLAKNGRLCPDVVLFQAATGCIKNF